MKLKTAIKRCSKLWHWLADNPNYGKSKWPGWHKYGYVANNCFACELAFSESGHIDCDKCFLKDLWPKNGDKRRPCMRKKSAYLLWLDSISEEDTAKYAKTIADYCDRLYDMLIH